ncbi:hypothetical protein Pfo_023300, partial [Paulownia fortunei]
MTSSSYNRLKLSDVVQPTFFTSRLFIHLQVQRRPSRYPALSSHLFGLFLFASFSFAPNHNEPISTLLPNFSRERVKPNV